MQKNKTNKETTSTEIYLQLVGKESEDEAILDILTESEKVDYAINGKYLDTTLYVLNKDVRTKLVGIYKSHLPIAESMPMINAMNPSPDADDSEVLVITTSYFNDLQEQMAKYLSHNDYTDILAKLDIPVYRFRFDLAAYFNRVKQ